MPTIPERADNILLHLEKNRQQPGVPKFISLIEEIVCKYQEKHLDGAIFGVAKYACPSVRDGLIKTIILESLLTKGNTTIKFPQYVEEEIVQFTQEEAASITKTVEGYDSSYRLTNIVYTCILKAFTIVDNYWWWRK
ncbi:MAG: hypothetical protein KBD37_01150 [Burkholderiales bacterium]|nr:hypothetical protein [Burkholderiales bacterium]